MGIQDLYDVINEECPEALQTIDFSFLAGFKLAVDVSIFLNKFVKTAGEVKWVEPFILLVRMLKKNGIKPVFIFDGPNPPPEKQAERDRRRAEAAKKAEKIEYSKTLLATIKTKYLPTRTLPPTDVLEEIKSLIGSRRGKVDSINYKDIHDIAQGLQVAIANHERQNLPILPIYAEKAKELITAMGFAYYQHTGEAEALCAYLATAKEPLVDGVLSEDTDVLAYGTPFLISKIDMAGEKATAVSHSVILEKMGLTHSEFLDLCILLSCDYNDRVKGYPPDGKNRKKPVGIGAKGAVAMIKEYRTLEKAEEYIEDADPLIYRRCRELFTPPATPPDITVPFNKPIDVKRLDAFLTANKVKISMAYILESWKPVKVNFGVGETEKVESDSEEEAPEDE
jgi:flap endonuclease-1